MHGQAFGSGLVRYQGGSEHRLGSGPNRLKIFDHFDTARLASAAGVNLCFDHPQRSAETLGSGDSRLRRVGDPALGDRDGVLGEQLFRLILVQIHELSLSADLVA
jgi:hypothetical protein